MRRPKMPMFFTTVGVVLFGLGAAVLSSWVLGLVVFGVLPGTWLPGPAAPASKLTWLDPVKVALTVAAGIGGAVALVVAYRKQRMAERQELESVYVAAAAQLGDASPTVRLAGVFAMANLADAWPDRQQQCVDVLCAYLRVPWDGMPDADHPLATKTIEVESGGIKTAYAYPDGRGELEVRKTILRVIGEHLKADRRVQSWSKLTLDFTGAVLPELVWNRAVIPRGARFAKVTFAGPCDFGEATFDGEAWFGEATFNDLARFLKATFNDQVSFREATFNDRTLFGEATFNGRAGFSRATFNGEAGFSEATFNGEAWFSRATFNGEAGFSRVTFNDRAWFLKATFDQVSFGKATFDQVSFGEATFTDRAWFSEATFTDRAWFGEATFNGEARFSKATFNGDAGFDGATFAKAEASDEVTDGVTFGGRVSFAGATFAGRSSSMKPQ